MLSSVSQEKCELQASLKFQAPFCKRDGLWCLIRSLLNESQSGQILQAHRNCGNQGQASVCRGSTQGEGQFVFSLSDPPPLPLEGRGAEPGLQIVGATVSFGSIFVSGSGERLQQKRQKVAPSLWVYCWHTEFLWVLSSPPCAVSHQPYCTQISRGLRQEASITGSLLRGPYSLG